MQNSPYKLSRLAQAHLLKIRKYTVENFSQGQWHKYKATLLLSLQGLAENSDLGLSCDDIYAKGFYFHVGKHTIYYTKESGFILVVAVLGQSQLPQNHLRKSSGSGTLK